jgi:hypothetical protein
MLAGRYPGRVGGLGSWGLECRERGQRPGQGSSCPSAPQGLCEGLREDSRDHSICTGQDEKPLEGPRVNCSATLLRF